MSQDFVKALDGEEEVDIEFIAKNGKKRKIPIWFVVDGRTLELLPMYGDKTKWFQAVEGRGKMELRAKGMAKSVTPTIVRDRLEVDGIKKKFSTKYGEDDVRKYYPTSEAALKVVL